MRERYAFSLTQIIAAVLILVFTYAALGKIFDFERFRNVLSVSPIIGENARIIALLIPSVELITSLCLLIPKSRLAGMWMSIVLMFAFTGYLTYMVLFIPNKPCSCGGILSNLSWEQHLGFNVALLSMSILGLIVERRNKLFIAIDRTSRIPV